MAEMDSSLEILASDSSASRLEKMQDLMNRLGLTNIKTEIIDLATVPQISAASPQHSPLSPLSSLTPSASDSKARSCQQVNLLSRHSPLSSLVSRLSSKFDRILLDVPCSNMGVIARRPESVYRMTPESINEVAELQFKILENASAALAPGGRLVYATCSPDPTETTRVIARFVKAHPEFVKVGEPVLPGLKDSRLDGFFAQALEYKK